MQSTYLLNISDSECYLLPKPRRLWCSSSTGWSEVWRNELFLKLQDLQKLSDKVKPGNRKILKKINKLFIFYYFDLIFWEYFLSILFAKSNISIQLQDTCLWGIFQIAWTTSMFSHYFPSYELKLMNFTDTFYADWLF